MKLKTFILIACFFVLVQTRLARGQSADSLKLALKNAKHDTTRCYVLNAMIEAELNDNIWSVYNKQLKNICELNLAQGSLPKSLRKFYSKQLADVYNNEGYLAMQQSENIKAIKYYEKSLKINEEIGNRKGMGPSLNNIGYIYSHEGNLAKGFEYYNKSYEIKKEAGDKEGMAVSLINIGLMYSEQGDIPLALEYYHKALKLYEQVNNKKGVSTCLNNIGGIYDHQNNIPSALEYYLKSLKIREELNDQWGMATSLNNVGGIYDAKGDKQKALEYYFKSLKIREEMKDKHGVVLALSNIGTIYEKIDDSKKDFEFFSKALLIAEEIKDKNEIALVEANMAGVLFEQGLLDKALKYGEQSLQYSRDLGYPFRIQNASEVLSRIYAKKGDYKKAYAMQVLFKQMADSVSNETNRLVSIQKGFQYAYEKKSAADSVKVVEEKKVSQAKLDASQASLKQERTQRFALYGGLILVLVFAGFMFNRFRVTQKQKRIIELKEKETQYQNEIITHQKHLVEEKHKEITDSINYAERIQRSFLASTELLDQELKDYFVFFKPKDVVSGDFYWASKLRNGQFALAVADSTGHGVPGAIMSLLNITSLERAIENSVSPADILNNTRKTIIDRLKKDGSSEGGKDGMDCSLMSFDFKTNKFTYTAANNPVWMVRGKEILEFSPDKMPVGKHDKDTVPFTEHEVSIQSGDVIYAITDGMPDQFGGPKGKKFMYKHLKEVLISIAHLSMSDQKEHLNQVLNEWRSWPDAQGRFQNIEQVDDICIIGVRV